jgi:hypothetical protein
MHLLELPRGEWSHIVKNAYEHMETVYRGVWEIARSESQSPVRLKTWLDKIRVQIEILRVFETQGVPDEWIKQWQHAFASSAEKLEEMFLAISNR